GHSGERERHQHRVPYAVPKGSVHPLPYTVSTQLWPLDEGSSEPGQRTRLHTEVMDDALPWVAVLLLATIVGIVLVLMVLAARLGGWVGGRGTKGRRWGSSAGDGDDGAFRGAGRA